MLRAVFKNCRKKNNTKVIASADHKRSKQRDEHFRIPRITCNLFKARENSRAQGLVGFDSDWLKNWCKIFKVIANRNNRVITFDSSKLFY